MTRKPELPDDLKAKLDLILDRAEVPYAEGNLSKAIAISMEAWDLIPDPKSSWDYYPQTLARGFVEDFTELGDRENAKKWIAIAYEVFDDPEHVDLDILMLEGISMHKLQDTDRAYYVFGRVHEIHGAEAFAGEWREYLEFYLAERASRSDN